MANRRTTETKVLAEIQPEAQEPELAARSENADSPSQELSPVFVQEVDSRNVHEATAVVVGELDAFSSTHTTTVGNQIGGAQNIYALTAIVLQEQSYGSGYPMD
ncbi:MAG: hypothetical protein LQ339_007892 [Xanthoria mediterranea]|nr:MAG: hypothetical protein LQ339_007892 [Xanthoria mediterranea]